MLVRDAYGPGKFGLSFELFPPKTDAGEAALWRNLDVLMGYSAELRHLHLRGRRLDADQDAGDRGPRARAVPRGGGLAPDVRGRDGRRPAQLPARGD